MIEGLGYVQRSDLGQIQPRHFPTTEVAVGVGGVGLFIGGLVVKKTPGTVMTVTGIVATLASGYLLLAKMVRESVPALPAHGGW